MTSIGLGMPGVGSEPPAPPTLAPRRKTRQLMVRDVGVGSRQTVVGQHLLKGDAARIARFARDLERRGIALAPVSATLSTRGGGVSEGRK